MVSILGSLYLPQSFDLNVYPQYQWNFCSFHEVGSSPVPDCGPRLDWTISVAKYVLLQAFLQCQSLSSSKIHLPPKRLELTVWRQDLTSVKPTFPNRKKLNLTYFNLVLDPFDTLRLWSLEYLTQTSPLHYFYWIFEWQDLSDCKLIWPFFTALRPISFRNGDWGRTCCSMKLFIFSWMSQQRLTRLEQDCLYAKLCQLPNSKQCFTQEELKSLISSKYTPETGGVRILSVLSTTTNNDGETKCIITLWALFLI